VRTCVRMRVHAQRNANKHTDALSREMPCCKVDVRFQSERPVLGVCRLEIRGSLETKKLAQLIKSFRPHYMLES
jgi:hypothetical protein